MALKDVLCVDGIETTAASKILARIQAARTRHRGAATFRRRRGLHRQDRLRRCHGVVDRELSSGTGCNPRTSSECRVGAAAAVAATVAAGSVRIRSVPTPAARSPTGCADHGGRSEATSGRVSRYRAHRFASSLDQIGPLHRTVEELALVSPRLPDHDPRTAPADPTRSTIRSHPARRRCARCGLGSRRVLFGEGTEPASAQRRRGRLQGPRGAGRDAARSLAAEHGRGASVYYVIAPAECSSNLPRYDGVRFGARVDRPSLHRHVPADARAGFGAEVKRRVMLGTYALSSGYYDAYYRQAQKVRTLVGQEFDAVFEQSGRDRLPDLPERRVPHGSRDDPLSMYMCDVVTLPADLGGSVRTFSGSSGAVDGLAGRTAW